MRKPAFANLAKATLVLALTLAPWLPSFAADLSGTWQGTLDNAQRVTLKIAHAKNGYYGEYKSQSADPTPQLVSSIQMSGRDVTFDLDRTLGTFAGTISADGTMLAGSWQTGGAPKPLVLTLAKPGTEWVIDASAHKVAFVSVAKDVQLEVLDWGGSGPPLVFLHGGSTTAHMFDGFAPRFTDHHHVYGITRRGFGVSSGLMPTRENFDPDRLGDDVLAVMAALKLESPVLIGHSAAGQEMSSIGSRHSEKVKGLIYLEAAWSFAFYNPNGGWTVQQEANDMRRALAQLPKGYSESEDQLREVLRLIPLLQKSVERDLATVEGLPGRAAGLRMTYFEQVQDVMATARRKYIGIKAPFMAIIAAPYKCSPDCTVPTEAAWAKEVMAQADAVQTDYPNARIFRLPYAAHDVIRSNEADVEREVRAFLDSLN